MLRNVLVACCYIHGWFTDKAVKRCAYCKFLVLTLSAVRSLFVLAQSSTHGVDEALSSEAETDDDVVEVQPTPAQQAKVCAP